MGPRPKVGAWLKSRVTRLFRRIFGFSLFRIVRTNEPGARGPKKSTKHTKTSPFPGLLAEKIRKICPIFPASPEKWARFFGFFRPAGLGMATFSYPLCFFRAASAPNGPGAPLRYAPEKPCGPGQAPGQRGGLGYAAGGAWKVRASVVCGRGADLGRARARFARAARCARAARALRAQLSTSHRKVCPYFCPHSCGQK